MTSLLFQNEIASTICPRMRVYFKKGAIRWTRFNGHIKETSQKASFKKIVISWLADWSVTEKICIFRRPDLVSHGRIWIGLLEIRSVTLPKMIGTQCPMKSNLRSRKQTNKKERRTNGKSDPAVWTAAPHHNFVDIKWQHSWLYCINKICAKYTKVKTNILYNCCCVTRDTDPTFFPRIRIRLS